MNDDDIKDIVEKYGRWDRFMKNGKYVMYKIISKRSLNKMIKELGDYHLELIDRIFTS